MNPVRSLLLVLVCVAACMTEMNAQWVQRSSTSVGTLTDVVMLTQSTAIAVGRNREILRTTDGGATWLDFGAPLSAAVRWNGAAFFDSLRGIIVGEQGVVRTTENGGRTSYWHQIQAQWECYSALLTAPGAIYVGADSGWVHHSIDSGSTWTSEKISAWPVRSLFIWRGLTPYARPFNTLHIYALTPYSVCTKTELPSTPWKETLLTQFRGLGSQAFDGEYSNNGSSGFIVGVQGDLRAAPAIIRITLADTQGTNAGSGIHRDGTLRGIAAPSDRMVYVCGSNGMLFKSLDTGSTWIDQSLPTTKSLNAVSFIDETHGIAVGDSGLILTTTNGGSVTAVDRRSDVRPLTCTLEQNYPNPFNPSTSIAYDIAQTAQVKIDIIDLLGRSIRLLADGNRLPGRYTIEWDGTTNAGTPAAAGIYFCRMRAGAFQSSTKLVLTR